MIHCRLRPRGALIARVISSRDPGLLNRISIFVALLGSTLMSLVGHAAPVVTDVSGGLYHTVFRKSDGSLWSMGYNGMGQVGNNTTNTAVLVPHRIVESGVVAVEAGEWHTAFIRTNGSLWTMGWNDWGALGDGSYSNRLAPVQVIADGAEAVSGGGFTVLFIRTNIPSGESSLWGMGRNHYGELGLSGFTETNRAVLISSANDSSSVTSVSGGNSHTLFLRSDGSLWGMGYNFPGQLGIGSTDNVTNPVLIMESNVVAMAAGGHHSLVIKSDSSLWAMGDNRLGQIGNGTSNDCHFPVEIVTSNVVTVSGGYWLSLFLKSDGSLWGMGDNSRGQLGDPQLGMRSEPIRIVSSNVIAIAAGGYHALFIKRDGSLWGMGNNYDGALGVGLGGMELPDVPIPTRIVPAAAVNGGVETGTLLGWKTNHVFSPVDNRVTTKAAFVRAGQFGLQLGQMGSMARIGQTRPTTPGMNYVVSFWLNCHSAEAPNEFRVLWNGTNVWSGTNLVSSGWNHHQVMVSAAETSSLLEFEFRNDNGYFGLDEIAFSPAEIPILKSVAVEGANLVLEGHDAIADASYVTLMSSSLATPISNWMPVATNVMTEFGSFRLVATNIFQASDSQRFVTVQLKE